MAGLLDKNENAISKQNTKKKVKTRNRNSALTGEVPRKLRNIIAQLA